MILYSPDGKQTCEPHPTKLTKFLEQGWTVKKPKQIKIKKEVKE